MRQGDWVVRKSYNGDVVFKIEAVQRDQAVLKGVDYRLLADSPLGDLMPADQASHRGPEPPVAPFSKPAKPSEKGVELPFFDLPGKILHLDGDPSYLRKSMSVYGQLRIPAEGHYVPEMSMPDALYQLLPGVQPDIVVITGHDGILKNRKEHGIHSLDSYKNSRHFAHTVKVARQYEKNRDVLTIIAGACQSHFEALLQAGANFASSPKRILIHALDPVYIAAKASYTSIKDTINIYDVINHTISGMGGLGGIETRGSYRKGLPKLHQS